MQKMWIAALCGSVLALPALAAVQDGQHDRFRDQPQTRAEVEARIKEHFAMLDANHDGFVEQTEAAAARAKMTAAMRDRHFAAMDTDHDGSISRTEFDAGLAARTAGDFSEHRGMGRGRGMHRGGRMGEMGGRAFVRADGNSDGKVSLAEVLTRRLARFDAADANKDGSLSPEERRAAWQTLRANWRDRRGQ